MLFAAVLTLDDEVRTVIQVKLDSLIDCVTISGTIHVGKETIQGKVVILGGM